jgi:molecular chaperone HscB
VQPLPAEIDLFAVLGLPRRLVVDAAELERRYHAASRAVHPDRFQTAGERERELSLAASAAVNRAYRTLRDPVARGRYWLELHGARLGDAGAAVPAAIAGEVFETQEKLEALRAAGATAPGAIRDEVTACRDTLAARLAALRAALAEGYAAANGDGTASIEALRRRLAEIAYLRTLLGDVEEALGEGLRGTDHRH